MSEYCELCDYAPTDTCDLHQRLAALEAENAWLRAEAADARRAALEEAAAAVYRGCSYCDCGAELEQVPGAPEWEGFWKRREELAAMTREAQRTGRYFEPCACNDPDCEMCQSRWTAG